MKYSPLIWKCFLSYLCEFSSKSYMVLGEERGGGHISILNFFWPELTLTSSIHILTRQADHVVLTKQWGQFGKWPSCFIYLFLYLEKGKEGRKRGKHQCMVASHMPPNGDLDCNPGTCPDWDSNQWPFSSQAGAQSTEPIQPGLNSVVLNAFVFYEFQLHVWKIAK